MKNNVVFFFRNNNHFSGCFYACCSLLAALILRLFCRVHLVILEAPPKHGAFIMASNHISHFEPAILGAFFPRALDWVAMEELFQHPWSAQFFSWLNTIAIDRFAKDLQANRRSFRTMLGRLAQGRAIGIFPEGGIRAGRESILEGAPMKPGLASLSLLSQTPVIPCVVLGSDRLYSSKIWLQRPSLWIIIGKPITPPSLTATPREKTRFDFQQRLSAAFPELQRELCCRFQLSEEDLPKAPRIRK